MTSTSSADIVLDAVPGARPEGRDILRGLTRFAGWYLVVALTLLVSAANQVADLDMYHQMALFRSAVENGSLPRNDIFAYTPTVTPSVHHEWGAGAILYLLAVSTGLGAHAVIALRFLMLAVIFGCGYICAKRRGGQDFLLLLAFPLALLMLVPGLALIRAHLYTFAAVAILLLFLQRYEDGEAGWVAVWLTIYLVWLNVHAGFVVGLGFFFLYLAERVLGGLRAGASLRETLVKHRVLALAMAGMLVLPLVNPYGLAYHFYVWEALQIDRSGVSEWDGLFSAGVPVALKAAFGCSMAVVLHALYRRRTPWLPGMSLLIAAASATVIAQRMLPIFAIVWFSFFPGALAGTPLEKLVPRLTGGVRVTAALLLMGFATFASLRALQLGPWHLRVPGTPYTSSQLHYPVGAVDYLSRTGFQGNVMTPFPTGAYVSWKLYPQVLVGMDSRFEAAYPPWLVAEIVDFYEAVGGWKSTLGKFPHDLILVPLPGPLDQAIRGDSAVVAQWPEVYRDAGYALFARRDLAPSLPAEDRRRDPLDGVFP